MTLDQLIGTLQNYRKDYGGDVEVSIAYDVQDWPSFQKSDNIDFYYYREYLTRPLLLIIASDS